MAGDLAIGIICHYPADTAVTVRKSGTVHPPAGGSPTPRATISSSANKGTRFIAVGTS